jgi:phosphoribosylformimino-5-aminoimidazole carboxamide ribotide isomerase
MTRFRPCIDIHEGVVKQIVGGSLKDSGEGLQTNFESAQDAAWYANLYKQDALTGGHIIQLGQHPQSEVQSMAALHAYPGGLQIGGGITPENAPKYLAAGASHVIVTSYLFMENEFSWERLQSMCSAIGKDHLVIDLSCRKTASGWSVATNRWQTITALRIEPAVLQELASYCAEFLVHAADVEGLQAGMDEQLIAFLGEYSPIPVTYAGGARSLQDLELAARLSNHKVDVTIGSALDIFGGSGVQYKECVAYNAQQYKSR